MFELGIATKITPETSPSVIKLILTPKDFNAFTILSCLGLFKMQAVNLSGVVFFAFDKSSIFFFMLLLSF